MALVLAVVSSSLVVSVCGFHVTVVPRTDSRIAASHLQRQQQFPSGSSSRILLHAKKPSSKGPRKSTQPEPVFSFAFKTNRKEEGKNQTPKKKVPAKKPKPPVAKKTTQPETTAKIPTLRIVENLQQSFAAKKEQVSASKTKQPSAEPADALPFFAFTPKDDDDDKQESSFKTERIVETLQNAVKLPSKETPPAASKPPPVRTTVSKPPIQKSPTIQKPVMKPSLPTIPSGTSTAPVNPIERVQEALEQKQAEVKQKALQTKQTVVGAVETTKTTIDSSVSTLQQLVEDIRQLPDRIQQAYARAVQFLEGIPPKVKRTADQIAAIPGEIQVTAKETKDKVTAIPGKIEAKKNDITDSFDRTVEKGKQTIQNIIDFPAYVQLKISNAKKAVDEFIYDVKVLFKQAPPRPKPPKAAPPQEQKNPIVGALFWVLKGVAGLTGKAVSATAGAVVDQVKKRKDATPMPPATKPPAKRKDGSKSVDDIGREADEALKQAEEALQSFKKQKPRDDKL